MHGDRLWMSRKKYWLVVSNMFYVPLKKWDVILPIDELIFFKMAKTTNQKYDA